MSAYMAGSGLTPANALQVVGGLSKPSKMPGAGYGLPVSACRTGSKLRCVEGSTCSKCYAAKQRYTIPHVIDAHMRRLKSLKDPRWVEAMSLLCEMSDHFRWHDSGDLQGTWHLQKIVQVALNVPTCKFWLPTREHNIVKAYKGEFPENLIVRLSAHMIDGPTPDKLARNLGVQVSGVSTNDWTCPAYGQGNRCGACRACWSRQEFKVVYKKH